MKYFYINNTKIKYSFLNRSIIDYCENIGIDIPHYCYHKNLSVAGNCRMCLIELKNSPKPVISCAMPILNKMEIFTNSPLVKKARENIMEFLLLNHPLDCPVCDQGGECDLQDQSFVFGSHKKRFYNFKRIVSNKNIGPIIKTVMTRCIHCTRCVRFSTEIAGIEDLGIFGRGSHSEIGTYSLNIVNSELSGNIIDICPVGALTSKQSSFLGRSWELKSQKSFDYSDGFGVDLQVFYKNNNIVKITSNTKFYWISDKIRFSFDGMFNNAFLKTEINGWYKLFKTISNNLYFQDHLAYHNYTPLKFILTFDNNISIEVLWFLITLEKTYTFIHLKKIEGFSKNEDLESMFLMTKADNSISFSDFCLLIGVNPRYEGYSLNLKLRQNFLRKNLNVCYLGSLINMTFTANFIGSNFSILNKIIKGNHFICQDLKYSKRPFVLYSSEISNHYNSYILNEFNNVIRKNTNISTKNWNGINFLNTALNSSGVSYMHKFEPFSFKDYAYGSAFYFININYKNSRLKKFVKLTILNLTLQSIEKLFSPILVEQSFFKTLNLNNTMSKMDFIHLPSAVFFENSGTYLNTEGYFKKTTQIISSLKNSKEDWKILRNLCYYLNKISYSQFKNVNHKLNIYLKNKNHIQKIIGGFYMPITKIYGVLSFKRLNKVYCNFFVVKKYIN